jgi:hypothetical protein
MAGGVTDVTIKGRRVLHRRRWIKQRDGHSCVPVAILNLLKWAGFSVTHRGDFHHWKAHVNHTPDGAHIRDYEVVLARISGLKLERRSRPSVVEIDAVLSEGNAVLLRSAWKAGDCVHRHLFLIMGRTEKSWFLTNTFRGHAWFPKSVVKTLYMEQQRLRSGVYPTAWFIYRQTKRKPAPDTLIALDGDLCAQGCRDPLDHR